MFTVKELIEKLSTMNPNAVVTLSVKGSPFADATRVSSYGYSTCECDTTTLFDEGVDENGNYGCCKNEGTVHCIAISAE